MQNLILFLNVNFVQCTIPVFSWLNKFLWTAKAKEWIQFLDYLYTRNQWIKKPRKRKSRDNFRTFKTISTTIEIERKKSHNKIPFPRLAVYDQGGKPISCPEATFEDQVSKRPKERKKKRIAKLLFSFFVKGWEFSLWFFEQFARAKERIALSSLL